MATNAQVRAMITQQPFQPYTVKLVGERVFTIRHPENLAMSPNGRDAVVLDDDGIHHLEAILIELIEPIPSTRQGNGA